MRNRFKKWVTMFVLTAFLTPLYLATTATPARADDDERITLEKKSDPRKPKPKPGPTDEGDGDS
jgi:hypothetical protein